VVLEFLAAFHDERNRGDVIGTGFGVVPTGVGADDSDVIEWVAVDEEEVGIRAFFDDGDYGSRQPRGLRSRPRSPGRGHPWV
jgi:hypothetical protein